MRARVRVWWCAAPLVLLLVLASLFYTECGGAWVNAFATPFTRRAPLPSYGELRQLEVVLAAALTRAQRAVEHETQEREAWHQPDDLLAPARDAVHTAQAARADARRQHARDAAVAGSRVPDGPANASIEVLAAVLYCDTPTLVNGANASEVLWRHAAGAYYMARPVLPMDADGVMVLTDAVAARCNGQRNCSYTVPYASPVRACTGKTAVDWMCGVAGPFSTAVRDTRGGVSMLGLACPGPPARRLQSDMRVGGVLPVRYVPPATSAVDGRARRTELRIWPLEFAIPETKFVGSVRYKTRAFARMIPGNIATYDMRGGRGGEVEYFRGYAESYYCVTRKKYGWDTMRHVEILASGCVPYFIDLHRLPASTMAFFPRALVWEAMHLPGVVFDNSQRGRFTDGEAFQIDFDVFNKTRYFELAAAIGRHARQHLTAEAMATYVLDALAAEGGPRNPRRVLFIHLCYQDYQSDSVLLGLKGLEERGALDEVVDWVVPAHLAEASWQRSFFSQHGCRANRKLRVHARPESLERREYNMYTTAYGHAAARNMDLRAPYTEGEILRMIQAKTFDAVVYGEISRARAFLDEVGEVYRRNEVALIRGADLPDSYASGAFDVIHMYGRVGVMFARELYDDADGHTRVEYPNPSAPGIWNVEGLHCCDMDAPPEASEVAQVRHPDVPAPPVDGGSGWVPLGKEDAEVSCLGYARFGDPRTNAWSRVTYRTRTTFPCRNVDAGGPFVDPAVGRAKECQCHALLPEDMML